MNKPRSQMNREERRQYLRELKARRTATPKPANDPRHGTENFYSNWGCRCERCKQAHHDHCYGGGRGQYFRDYYRNVTVRRGQRERDTRAESEASA